MQSHWDKYGWDGLSSIPRIFISGTLVQIGQMQNLHVGIKGGYKIFHMSFGSKNPNRVNYAKIIYKGPPLMKPAKTQTRRMV